MATTHASPYELHDHAGARWLATAGAPVLLLILAVIAMLGYPHI